MLLEESSGQAAMGLLTGDVLATLALALAIFLLLVDLMHRRPRWAARYPPGPMSLPGLGNLLQVDFQDISRSFGQVREVTVECSRGPGHPPAGDMGGG